MTKLTLKEQLRQAETDRDNYRSLVLAFWGGEESTMGLSLQRQILAQWGRKRLDHLRSQASLFRPPDA